MADGRYWMTVAALAVVALLAAFMAWCAFGALRARRLIGLPRAAVRRWRHASPTGKLLACILAFQLTYTGATKLLRTPPPAASPAVAVVQPDAGDLDVEGAAPVTNLCLAAIERGTNSTALLLAWPPTARPPLGRVGLFGALGLPGPWSRIFDVDLSACASNALVEVADSDISTNGPPGTAFFRLGDPAPPDADGDGLSDVEEAGGISVLDEFEWHDTAGFDTAYAPPPPSGLGSYFGAYLIAGLPGGPVIDGVALTQAIAFEGGLVALSAPDDFYAWTFPEAAWPLCYRWGWAYSALVAPYWGSGRVQYGNADSYMRAGTLADGTAVVEFHDVKRSQMSSEGMTCQVAVPGGTGNVVRVSYLSSDFALDGTGAVAGVQNARRALPGGRVYSLEWDFAARGPIVPPVTVEYRLGLGTDPRSADSDGDGLGDRAELFETGTDPWSPDSDGDGLHDGDEIAWGTDPLDADTDGDGLPDAWEAANGLDPTSGAGDDGASGDPDGDGLANEQERQLGTDPLAADTDADGDGLPDVYEVNVLGSSPFLHDTDGDGLDDLQEQTLATNPLQPDTDGDGMDDGWEHQHGFDPKTHNSNTVRTDDDATADPDGDGLANAEECAWGTNPCGVDADGDGIPDGLDTDGDGVADGVEIAQDSDPADASDGGRPGSRVPVPFYFGDHSGSHSEKYLLEVAPVAALDMGAAPRAFSWVNARYGECETRTAALKPGWKYEVRLRHAATSLASPDYDYTLRPVTNGLPPFVQVSDPGSLFGVDDSSISFSAEGKAATVSVYRFTVEEIMFNHDRTSCSADAVSLRKNLREEYGGTQGEWWTGGETLKNDPVCYAGGVVPMVKVKFRVSPDLASARLSARAVGADSPLGSLGAEDVEFSAGHSTWFDFRMDSRIARTVRRADHRWEWRVSMVGGKNVTAFACATTGPHRVYTVLDVPKEPWEPNGTIQCPWADALELACTVAEGKSDKVQALAAVTTHLFQGMGFVYDTSDTDSHYCKRLEVDEIMFAFDDYLKTAVPQVNCSDQAYGLATFGNLMGIPSTVVMTQPIGYINAVNLVGVGACNNPGYLGTGTSNHVAVCGSDDTSRTKFTYHRYVFAEGVVFDACIGPALGTQTRLEYLRQVIDSSTEAERIKSPYSPLGPPSTTDFEKRNYYIIGVK